MRSKNCSSHVSQTVVVRRQFAFHVWDFFDQMWDALSGSFEPFWLNIVCLNVWQLGCNIGLSSGGVVLVVS